MATISLANTEGEGRQIDLKQATVQVQPVTLDTPSLTPATTPEHNSPSDELMAGKKVFSLEKPTDKARELAAKLTLEEQVRTFVVCRKSLDHHEHETRQTRDRMSETNIHCPYFVYTSNGGCYVFLSSFDLLGDFVVSVAMFLGRKRCCSSKS
jgi:hypothetical protein